ncbi:HIT-like protein [Sistotremastrum suecicum HHB10207 ss-3]|uniref:HIT-like protein n=1 Tax=Sistotremastrum suecicum HHB10207 ss-3 TaxID=1314776 RepID=A0A165ZV74_9AGAM|nr:HIT-like protein [Sistotremastrum suecicum HHB10207 ss-3]
MSNQAAIYPLSSGLGTLDDGCIFCLIIQGKIPSFKIAETELSVAFLDINPVSEGHTLVIPKHHAVTLHDLPDPYLADILPLAKKIAGSLAVKEFNIVQNNGKIAFQHVDHVHFHVVPKPSETEGLIIKIDENWPQKVVSKEELGVVAEKLRGRL